MRWIKPIENPTQYDWLVATCGQSCRPLINAEVWSVHLGEDGPSVNLVLTRQFEIEDQCSMWVEGMRDDYREIEMQLIGYDIFATEVDDFDDGGPYNSLGPMPTCMDLTHMPPWPFATSAQ